MTITGKDDKQTKYWMRIELPKKGGKDEDGGAGSRRDNLKPHERFIGFTVRHRSAKPRHHKMKQWGGDHGAAHYYSAGGHSHPCQ